MSYKFWADVNTQAIVYYRPISKAEAIKINDCQDPEEQNDYPFLLEDISHYEPFLRRILKEWDGGLPPDTEDWQLEDTKESRHARQYGLDDYD